MIRRSSTDTAPCGAADTEPGGAVAGGLGGAVPQRRRNVNLGKMAFGVTNALIHISSLKYTYKYKYTYFNDTIMLQ